MHNRLATWVAFLSVAGFLGWLVFLASDGPAHEEPAPSPAGTPEPGAPQGAVTPSEGSVLPCDVPLAWRIERVDEEFGLGADEVRAAVERATRLWEEAAGRELFRNAPRDGFPVHFVYDERQARTQERRRLMERFREEDEAVTAELAGLDSLRERFHRRREERDARARRLEERVEELNEEVQRWNERGGAPPSVREALEERGEDLVEERRELEREGEALERLGEEVRQEEARLDERARELDEEARELERAFPMERVRSGRYGEMARLEGGEVVSVDRELVIHRFDDREDLVRVVAHELGHALGLAHAEVPGAVMSAEYRREDVTAGETALAAADVALLRGECPHLLEDEPEAPPSGERDP